MGDIMLSTTINRRIRRSKRGMALSAAMLCIWMIGLDGDSVFGQIPAERLAPLLQQAIDRGVEYLKRQQKPDGSWSDSPPHVGGVSALCTLALLTAGVPPDDPVIQKALRQFRRFQPQTVNSTYSVSLQTMVLCRAEPDRDAALIQQNIRWLERVQVKDGPDRGGWSYPGFGVRADNSNSQFALLALYEAERVGIRASDDVWKNARDYWEGVQNPDGSWGYQKGLEGTGSMTCAGISALVIVYAMVHSPNAVIQGDQIQCCQAAKDENDRIRRGLNWLSRNFSVRQNPQSGSKWLLYYLYGLERVGRLTSQRFIGSHDWYREGSAFLLELKTRRAGGDDAARLAADYWVGPAPAGTGEDDPLVATAFALLFLAKGRRPILAAKLKWGDETAWNPHHNDLGNLTEHLEKAWKIDLGWQVVDLMSATVDDLQQSPVLYFGGSRTPLPPDAAAQRNLARKLRDYLDRGGFIVAEAVCPQGDFDRGFRELMELAFPEPEYRLRLLPPEHPIWRAETAIPPEHVRPLLGVDFGCRTSVVYSPPPQPGESSLSCLWEISRAGRETRFAEAVQSQVDAALALGRNIMAYATNRQLSYKYEFFDRTVESQPQQVGRRNLLAVAVLQHPGGCSVAPRAVTNLLETAQRELGLRVDLVKYDIAITDDSLFDFHLAFMHGRNAFRLTPEERSRLRTYVQRGGMILADAVCSSQAFSESFRFEMQAILPEHPLQPIPPDDALLRGTYGGFDLQLVTRRDPQPTGPREARAEILRKVPPELEGVRMDGRWAIIFSPYDLSCALEKQQSTGCQGYIPEDAARIGLNVLLYSLQE